MTVVFGHRPVDVQRFEVEPETVALLASMVAALSPQYVIETGSYHGTTSRAIGEALDNTGHLDTMDIDEQSVEMTRLNVIGLPVNVHHCSSFDFTPRYPIELAFLDSDIGDTRIREMERFRPYMTELGIVAIHDAGNLWSGWPLIDGWRWVRLATPNGLLMAQVDA